MWKSSRTRCACVMIGWVIARAAAAEESAPADSAGTKSLEEVVVTATKRAEKLQDVPVSVTAISSDTLTRLGAEQFTDYAGLIPGLSFVGGGQPGHDMLILRGVSTSAAATGPTVGTYIDDSPFGTTGALALGSTLTPDPDLLDIDHIEVLKGPQGTLYGASTLGGLLKIVTKTPDLNNFEGLVRVGGDSVSRGDTGYSVRGVVNTPLSDGVSALRVAGYYRRDPGFIDDVGLNRQDINNATNYGGRASFLLEPMDAFSILISALVQDDNSNGRSLEEVDRNTFVPTYGDLTARTLFPEVDNLKYRLVNAKLSYGAGVADVTNVLSYDQLRDSSVNDTTLNYGFLIPFPNSGSPTTTIHNSNKVTEEFRVASPTDEFAKLTWLGGLYYTHEQSLYGAHLGAVSLATGQPIPGFTLYTFDLHLTYREYAGFGDLTCKLTDTIDFTTGARWSRNTQDFNAPNSGRLSSVPVFRGKSADSTWTFQETLRWKPTRDLMTYLRAASGYRPGGPIVPPGNVPADFPTVFKPDTVWNYEAGTKSTWLDGRLSANAATYLIDWKNIQTNARVGAFTILTNGGNARSKGVEIETAYTPTSNWTVGLSGSYTDAVLGTAAHGSGAASGDPLPNTPRWSGGLTTDYSIPLAGGWNANMGATLRYTGRSYSGFSATPSTPRVLLPEYKDLQLRAGVSDKLWDVTFHVFNLLNERAITSLTTISPALPSQVVVVQPRTFDAVVTYHF
jgi:iron complex outermembrane recepter protein